MNTKKILVLVRGGGTRRVSDLTTEPLAKFMEERVHRGFRNEAELLDAVEASAPAEHAQDTQKLERRRYAWAAERIRSRPGFVPEYCGYHKFVEDWDRCPEAFTKLLPRGTTGDPKSRVAQHLRPRG